MAKKIFSGNTQDAKCPILGAEFWRRGITIAGAVRMTFQTENGPVYTIELKDPIPLKIIERKVSLDPDNPKATKYKRVGVGNLKGFVMAMQEAGLDSLLRGDAIVLKCTGTTPTEKGNDMIDFNLAVEREGI